MSQSATAPKAKPVHLSCLTKCPDVLASADGRDIEVWDLTVPVDEEVLSSWARAFRQNYCPDDEIDLLRDGTGLSRREYLTSLVFPDAQDPPGPGIRSGDFAELLVSDFVEHVLEYWVPRGKYADKASRDESVKGVDILGFKLVDAAIPGLQDEMVAFEVKAQAAGGKYTARLQQAVDDSSKDYLRRGMTLNATKRRLMRAGQFDEALRVRRFQNPADYPYTYRSGAAAFLSDDAFDAAALQASTSLSSHSNALNTRLIVIRGVGLMRLIHAIYERAACEA